MSWVDIVGYSAALAVLAAFCMSSIVPLRIVAILSNVLFALYGLSAHLYPVFLLHSILLPINVFKLTHLELLPGRQTKTASERQPPRHLCRDRSMRGERRDFLRDRGPPRARPLRWSWSRPTRSAPACASSRGQAPRPCARPERS